MISNGVVGIVGSPAFLSLIKDTKEGRPLFRVTVYRCTPPAFDGRAS